MDISDITGNAVISEVSERRVRTFIEYYEPRVVERAQRVPLGWIWRGYIKTGMGEFLRIITVNSRANFLEATLQCAILEIDGILHISDTAVSLIRISAETRAYAQKNMEEWQGEWVR